MARVLRVGSFSLIMVLLLGLSAWGVPSTYAQKETEPPVRQTEIIVDFTSYEWWLIRWTDNLTVCQLFIEHEGPPTGEDVLSQCGQAIYDTWRTTPPCKAIEKGKPTTYCLGLYTYLAGYQSGQRSMLVDLPLPTVWLTVEGCDLSPPENFCRQRPSLVFTGEEPLPNEKIIRLHIRLEEREYVCEGDSCQIPLNSTPLAGVPVEFWAESSFGDSSEHFTALVRVIESGVAPASLEGWYVDILSSQWRGGPTESCAQVWQAFPPPGGPPPWLSTPSQEVLLATDQPYQYLAGRLIFQGLVDASECPGNGLLENGYADACGLEKARSMVSLWQNQFDDQIIRVAQETGLPAQILKNLFAQESQFWPGTFRVAHENGLGQLTDLGADTILLWNPSFYNQFCPLVLAEETCARGYLKLGEEERLILRGALANQANSDCPECPAGVDLTHADFSIHLFAQSILANCGQVGQTITNATQQSPGAVSSYEDLWRFTLANYNGGPGCLAFAIHTTWALREPLDWEHVSTHFTQPCQGVLGYVNLIAR